MKCPRDCTERAAAPGPRAIPVLAFVMSCVLQALLSGCSGNERALASDDVAEIGRHYMTGTSGFPIDVSKAREFFETAAQKGSGAGLFYLGLVAYEGGQQSDLKQACGLFAQSAARNHPGGLREYGECQLRGTGGMPKNSRDAAIAFRASIANGGVEAYVSLAKLYELGDGVQKDPQEAARLLAKHAALVAHR
jgi:TPR repeat protein